MAEINPLAEDAGEAEAALETNAVAVALALDEARDDPKLRSRVDAFLDKQSILIDAQLHHLHEQFAQLRIKRIGEIFKVVLQGVFAVTALAVVGVLATMAWSAHNDHSLTIQAMNTPPDLAAQGLTGPVLAAELQDKILTLESQTVTYEQTAQISDSRASDIQVEIPETGVSLGELNRLMRDWLGHETRVSGEIAHSGSGLAMTVRVGDAAGERAVRPDSDVDALLQSAAESVYRAAEPHNFVSWLREHGRSDDAVALLTELSQSGPPLERARADVALSNRLSQSVQADRALLLEAVRLDPNQAGAWNALGVDDRSLGHPEVAMQDNVHGEKTTASWKSLAPGARTLFEQTLRRNMASLLGAAGPTFERSCSQLNVSPCTIKDLVDAAVNVQLDSRIDASQAIRMPTLATVLADVHDPEDAERVSAAPRVSLEGRDADYQANVGARWLDAAVATDLAREDWAGVVRDADAYQALAKDWPGLSTMVAGPALDRAYALAKLGRQAEAEAAIASTPLDCTPCLMARGRIAAVKGDWPAADHWFALAIRSAPSMPQAYDQQGQMLLARGQPAAAIARFELANQRSPQFADPLKDWGDALARLGQWKLAVGKYDEALKYAPTWAALQQARAAAAKHAQG